MANISEKMREVRLRWLGHVARKTEEDVAVPRCSNENTEDGSGWTPKYRKTETEVELCHKKIHEGETSKDRRSTIPENVEIENSMRRLQIGKRKKKKKYCAFVCVRGCVRVCMCVCVNRMCACVCAR